MFCAGMVVTMPGWPGSPVPAVVTVAGVSSEVRL